LFEFLCGALPFGENTDDPYEIYSEILSKKLQYAAFMKDKKAKKILEQLLNRTPELRNGGSFAALKSHQWFEQFDWDKLMEKELKPPFIPPKNRVLTEEDIVEKRKLRRPLLKIIEVNL
jgi:cGMP-dependent protein kinase 1